MVKFPKISIVTPTFNQGDFIEETICSVLDQNYPNLDYVIIDGGSTDQTVETIRKYEKHLTYWVSEPDKGQSDAINKGFEKCTGDIFNWLNSDDLLMPGALNEVATWFNDPSLHILSGSEYHFDHAGEVFRHGSLLYPSVEESMFYGVIYQPSTFWRVDALRPLLPLNANLHFLMDSEIWVRYLVHNGQGGIKKTGTPLAKFRIHGESKTTSQQEGFLQERWDIRGELFRSMRRKPPAWIEYMEAAGGKTKIRSFESSGKFDERKMLLLYAEELVYTMYLKFSYDHAREILMTTLFEYRLVSKRLVIYFMKICLMPRFLLTLFRKSHA
ncbi:MAG: glycosyltransferase [Cyclobacteriaceae bacterium]|nr:glycosyltransferase [Cyclobacteriaceae bacterium]